MFTSHIRASAQLMRGFLKPLIHVPEVAALEVVNEDEGQLRDNDFRSLSPNPAIDLEFAAYPLDIEYEEDDLEDEEETEEEPESEDSQRKRRKILEVPAREVLRIARENRMAEFKQGLDDLEKHIKSRKTLFEAGDNGLQATRARAIQSYMHLIVRKGHKKIKASEMSALTSGFAARTGGRLIRLWARDWMVHRELPTSDRGRHVKVKSLLEDPSICAEMRTYLRSHKWATNPKKFADFTQQKLFPAEAEKYAKHIVDKEMPRGLKKYLEVELFPQIQMKVRKGISISTARRWMERQGFYYTKYKKALYFDGHERPDVVHYRQHIFLPLMAEYRSRLMEYRRVEESGYETFESVVKSLPDGVRKLVLCAHDESTMQANDSDKAGWGPEDEQPLLKKGVGCGSHRSDVIFSTVGWLEEAGHQENVTGVITDYGKIVLITNWFARYKV